MGEISKEPISFRLYIAGRAPNSDIALNNVKIIFDDYLKYGTYKLEIVDILKDPMRAIDDGVLLTPTLVRLSPLPAVKIQGNLCRMDKVIQILGMDGCNNGR
ncbi:MAG: circadian clock KaiB family protein [Methanotrichaceae archaeon]